MMDEITHGTQVKPTVDSIVGVAHEVDDGWHTFTSPQVPGLYMIGKSEDLEELYASVPKVIEELARADFGLIVKVTQRETFSSYIERMNKKFAALELIHYSVTSEAA